MIWKGIPYAKAQIYTCNFKWGSDKNKANITMSDERIKVKLMKNRIQ